MSRAFKNYLGALNSDAIPSEEDAQAAAIAEVRSLFNSSAQIYNRVSASRAELEKKKIMVCSHRQPLSVLTLFCDSVLYRCFCLHRCFSTSLVLCVVWTRSTPS
jgi:hypothetical protein